MRRAVAPLVLAVALSACPGDGGGSPAKPSVRPVRGGALHVGLAEDVDFLDPHRAAQPAALAVMRAMHRGLMAFPAATYPRGSDPVPDLAAAPPEVSPDRLVYTFRLREGISFGPPASRPLTANDVRAGISRLLRLDSPHRVYYRVIAAVSTPDEQTVVVRLAKPVNDLLWILAHPAASAVPADLEQARAPRPESISPLGPYRLAGYRPEEEIHLVRNPAWKASLDGVRPAYVDQIRIRVGTSPADLEQRLDRGEIDMMLDTPPAVLPVPPTVSPTPASRVAVQTVPSGCLRYLWMNTTVAPFGDVRARRAVATAIGRDAMLVGSMGPGRAVATASPLVRGITGATEAPVPTPDPTAAAATFRTLRLPPRFSGRLVVGDRREDVEQGRAVVAALREASFPVRLEVMPIASLYVDGYEVPSRRIPMGIATWCADWPGLAGRAHLTPLLDGRTISRSGNQNYSMVRDGALQALLDAASLASPNEAAAAWQAASARVTELAAWVPLLDLSEVSAVGPRVGGFVASPLFPRGDLTAVWIRAGAPPPATPSGSR